MERGAKPGEITFDKITRRSVDTFERMVQFLKTGQRLPSFDFAGVGIENGGFVPWDYDCNDNRGNPNIRASTNCKVSASPKYEPDAAGATALMGVMAWDRWRERKYLTMADLSIQALLSNDRNPYYELHYNFGVLAAARMNQEHGYQFDLDKLLNWAFSRGKRLFPDETTAVRWTNGIIAENWGQFPAFGLWGGKRPYRDGGRAFYMNTIHQAITLAPIVKYYPEYATMFGKYLLHVANNSKVFFPYEALAKHPNKGAIATSDALELGWARTDLSLYSGAVTGVFSAMMKPNSDNPEVPFWDLNISNFQSPKSFPTFLIYNPNVTPVVIRRTALPKMADSALWDSIQNRWIAENQDGKNITLAPGQAMVLTLVPRDSTTQIRLNKLIGTLNGIESVIDYKIN